MDMRSPYAVSLADLPRQEGSEQTMVLHFHAPEGVGVDLMRVPEGSLIDVALTVQSVKEGVYAYGHIHAHAVGECARCLGRVERTVDEPFGELIYYPQRLQALRDSEDENVDEYAVIDNDHIDCEPIIRDCVVLSLPLIPLCHPDCRGLCPECGQRLDDLPDGHHHDILQTSIDPLDVIEAQMRAQEKRKTSVREGE